MKRLLDIFPTYGILKREEIQHAMDSFSLEEHGKGDLLLRPGQTCKRLYFIHTGLVYAYANDETERILWYEFEGRSFTDILSYYSQTTSSISIKVAEDHTLIASISYENLQGLFKRNHNWAIWGVYFQQNELSRITHYYENLRVKDASQRYRELVATYPEILQRVPLGHIASYLGICQVSLSRIRAGTQKKQAPF